MICGWHISSSVSAESTSAAGSATNADHRAMSCAVLASPAHGANALGSTTGSSTGTSVNGGT